MLLVPVVSSDIAAMGYDPDGLEMQIQFTTGRVYSYQPFPPDIYQALFSAPSKGRYFAQFIKKFPATYPYRRIDQGVATPLVPSTPPPIDVSQVVPENATVLQTIEAFEGLL